MLPFKQMSLLVLISLGLLASCGPQQMKKIRTAKQAVIGEDVARLAECIGEPVSIRAAPDGTGQIYAYSSAQAHGEDGSLLGAPKPDDESSANACVIEFNVVDGRILDVNVDNRAGWGGGSIKKCAGIVQRCAPQ